MIFKNANVHQLTNSGMGQFKKDFGRIDPATGEYAIPTTWQSVGSGTPSAGIAIGCLLSASISKHLGRKRTFLILAVVALVGILIQVTAKSFWQLFAGRMVNSLSMGIICSVVPVYQTECAPPAIRGAAINFYQFWFVLPLLENHRNQDQAVETHDSL